jgi:alpha-tubulin suppressor-like RCC1 family protein
MKRIRLATRFLLGPISLALLAACADGSPADPSDGDPVPQPNPVPALTSLSPATATAGSAGLVVSIQGTGFVEGTTARWNGTPRQTVRAEANRLELTLTAADLAVPDTGLVTAHSPSPGGGTSQALAFVVEAPPNPAPSSTALTPGEALVGAGELELQVLGDGFIAESRVRWDGAERETTFVDSSRLLATIPAEDLSQVGEFDVTVRNPAPGGGDSGPAAFRVIVPPQIEARSRIGTGRDFACALDPSGQASCWGSNLQGQLGSGAGPRSLAPRPVSGGHTFEILAVGSMHVCGVSSDASLYCWGDNEAGTIGNGSRQSESFPQRIAADRDWAWVSAAQRHTCAVTTDGDAYCWGDGWNGKLGIGSTNHPTQPTAVSGGHRFRQISTGADHTCALGEAGDAWCWGSHFSGRTGTGATSGTANTPQAVDTDLRFAIIMAGVEHTCALTEEGEAWCWGSNAGGALGNGGFSNSSVPVPVSGGHRFQGIASGHNASCGTVAAGATRCWGSGEDGQTGRGDESSRRTPEPIVGGVSLVDVAMDSGSGRAGWGTRSCGLDAQGAVWCWGTGEAGGVGEESWHVRHLPAPIQAGGPFVELDVGQTVSCALDEVGAPFCWGSGLPGPTPSGSWSPRFAPIPVSVPGAPPLHGLDVGASHACALDAQGAAWCWGANSSGQLGDGTTTSSQVAVKVQGGVLFDRLSAGASHSCGIDPEGGAWCWGWGSSGRLGTGSTDSEPTPAPVETTVPFARISAGGSHTCALTTEGEAWCWGNGLEGQTGTGGGNVMVPTQVSGDLRFRAISAGASWSCGITSAPGAGLDEGPGVPLGELYCWGLNAGFRMGVETSMSNSRFHAPFRFPTSRRFTRIETGLGPHACAVDAAEVPFCWGRNRDGELARDPQFHGGDDPVPGAISGLTGVVRIVPGNTHVCALTTSGEVFCWGSHHRGRLGDGAWGFTAAPVRIGGL